MVSSVRFALCSLFLFSFDLKSVTIFNHVKDNFNVPHGTGLVDFPHPALQQNSRTKLYRRVVIRAVLATCRYSVQCPTLVSSSLCVLPPTPSSGLRALAGHYSDYSSTMSWSDCHAAIPPPCLFRLVGGFPSGATWLSQVPMQTVDDLPWT